MIFYLVGMIRSFLPVTLMLGLLLASGARRPAGRLAWGDLWGAIAGILAAHILQKTAVWLHAATQTAVALPLVALAFCLFLLLGLAIEATGRGTFLRIWLVFTSFLLTLAGMEDLLGRLADHAMSATGVVNTEFILNIGVIVLGTAALFAVFLLVWHAGRRIPALVRRLLTATALLLAIAVWASQAALGLLQLGSLDATGDRLTLVARLMELIPYAAYAQVALIVLLLAGAHAARRRPSGVVHSSQAEERKETAAILGGARWRRALGLAGLALLAVLLYNDLYASRPPSLSAAATVLPDAAGLVHVKLDEVRDGKLHRYAYITGDGHRVRFFLINRYDPAHAQIGVVFDACKLCGDMGYVQNGNEIICVACNVRIFVPSIGKPGGCNPIPLPHQVGADEITIAEADLEAGARYFTETVDIKVTDPVSGAALVNRTAPYKYDYQGRMYYFQNQASYDRFRDDPDKYVVTH